jgi:hypothetical protein
MTRSTAWVAAITPRFVALDIHLGGTLPDDYDTLSFHQRADVRPAIERGSAAVAGLWTPTDSAEGG